MTKPTSPTRKGGPKPGDEAAVAKLSIIEHYGDCGTLLEASKRAGVTYSIAKAWKDSDPAFALALQQSHGVFVQTIEEKARQIALGDSDPKMVMFFLRCLDREKYGDTRRMEHTGPGGGPIMIHSTDQAKAQLVAVAHQFPTVAPRLRAALQEILDALPK
jgi:hypothetical protein